MKTTVEQVNDPVLGDVTKITIDPERIVLCDFCNKDFTNSQESGGFLFGRYGIGPCCAVRARSDIERYGETVYIRATCPEGKSFADWIREDAR